MRNNCWIVTALVGTLCLWALPATAQVTWTVSFDDPAQAFSSYHDTIQRDVLAAGASWSHYLQGDGALNLDVIFDPSFPTAEGASTTTAYVCKDGATYVYEQGASYKARTGLSAGGGYYDGDITLGGDYLTQDLWFDPTPLARTAPVPTDKVDAVSVFEHEIGHILAFNGFRNAATGALSSYYESTFDRNVTFSGSHLYFDGPSAEAVYGGPVPLMSGDYGHVGNPPPGPGQDLLGDLMNGYSLKEGTRYAISPLDVAIAEDAGVAAAWPTGGSPSAGNANAVPEGGPAFLAAAGLMLLAVPARRRRRQH